VPRLRPEIEPDGLVDELQGVGSLVVGSRVDQAGPCHLVEEVLPAVVSHRPMPSLSVSSESTAPYFFHIRYRKGDLTVERFVPKRWSRKELLASAPQYNLSVAYTSASLLFSQVDDPKRGYGARIERSQSIDAIMVPRRSPPDAALRSRAGRVLWSC
jgi:hypothetical protein